MWLGRLRGREEVWAAGAKGWWPERTTSCSGMQEGLYSVQTPSGPAAAWAAMTFCWQRSSNWNPATQGSEVSALASLLSHTYSHTRTDAICSRPIPACRASHCLSRPTQLREGDRKGSCSSLTGNHEGARLRSCPGPVHSHRIVHKTAPTYRLAQSGLPQASQRSQPCLGCCFWLLLTLTRAGRALQEGPRPGSCSYPPSAPLGPLSVAYAPVGRKVEGWSEGAESKK